MKNTLIEKVAIQLKAAKTKEEFDSIIKYHCLEQYKKELEKYGVKFDNFVEEDIKDLDQQDRFEHLYNTRFEQENIITYPR